MTWAVDGSHLRSMRNGEFRTWFDMGGKEQRWVAVEEGVGPTMNVCFQWGCWQLFT